MSDNKPKDYIGDAFRAVKAQVEGPGGKVIETVKKNPTLAGAVGGFFVAGPFGAAAGAIASTEKGRQKAVEVANTAIGAGKNFVEGLAESVSEDDKPGDPKP